MVCRMLVQRESFSICCFPRSGRASVIYWMVPGRGRTFGSPAGRAGLGGSRREVKGVGEGEGQGMAREIGREWWGGEG